MEAFALAFMAMGLLVLLVFIMYLLDRVNTLERETRLLTRPLNAPKEVALAGPFAGLSSKKLWDAMSGRLPDGLDASTVDEVRVLYETVLHKHVDAIFQEGVKDGQRGMLGEPKNTKQISTSKGLVESWIPSAQANALYQCGLNASQTPEAEWGPIRASMDEAGQFLMGKTQLDASSPLSDWLMPVLNPAASPGAAQGPQAVLAPAVEPAGTPGSVAS